MISFATQVITRLRAGETVDGYGSTVLDWSAPDSLDVEGCSVQPVNIDEQHQAERDAVPARLFVIAPPGADVIAVDRIVYAGRTYDIAGEPDIWATGVLDHVEFYLTDVRG